MYRVVVPRKEIRYLSFPYPDVKRALELILDRPCEVAFI